MVSVIFHVKVECRYFALSILYLIFLSKFANFSPLLYTPISNWLFLTVIPYKCCYKWYTCCTAWYTQVLTRFIVKHCKAVNRNSICWIWSIIIAHGNVNMPLIPYKCRWSLIPLRLNTLLVNVIFLFSFFISHCLKTWSFNFVCFNSCNQTIVMKIRNNWYVNLCMTKPRWHVRPAQFD